MNNELTDMIATSDAFEKQYYAEHFGDRCTHKVIGRDCSIMIVFPEYEDEQGERIDERRQIVSRGCDIDLGREYHVPVGVNAHEFMIELIQAHEDLRVKEATDPSLFKKIDGVHTRARWELTPSLARAIQAGDVRAGVRALRLELNQHLLDGRVVRPKSLAIARQIFDKMSYDAFPVIRLGEFEEV